MSVLKKFARIVYFRKIRIQTNGKLKLLLAATIGVILLLASGPALMAATQAQINASTTAGVVWLVAQQQGDGSWHGSAYTYYAATTGFALGALEHYAEKLGKTPLDPTYTYYTNVQNGLNYLFSSAIYDAGNSWVHWETGSTFYDAYQTGPALMGIARSGAPDAVVNVSGCALNGFTYKQVAQMGVDWIGSAQITSGQGTGAWYYNKNASNTTGDQSATGWATLGLGYAVHSMGCTWPAGLLTRLALWNAYIQCPTPGTDFGGAGYTSVCNWNNIYKTGHLLFALGLTGKTIADQAVIDALTYMDTHWADASADPGWRGSSSSAPHCIAIAAAAKGFTELEIETFSGHNWYNDFADRVVGAQYADGHWLGGGPHGDPDTTLSTCWSLLGLLRATSHFPPIVTTGAADNLGPFTATLHGSLTDMGTAATVNLSFQYGTTSGSLTSETTAAAYSSTLPYAYSAAISGLTMGTRYYFRAKAVGDATGYGDELYFDTLPVPTVTTTAVTAITNVSATSGGNVTADNGTSVTVRGVCWSTSANPTISDSLSSDGTGTGVFSSSITPLAGSTVYHVRAYATNTAGTGYGADVVFTTAAIVTASAGANGSLDATTPSPVIVNYNSTTSFKFNADANYHVASVSGCSGTAYTNTSNAVSSYTYTTGAVTGACTVTATFAINQYTVSASAGANGSLSGSTPSPATVSHGATTSFTFNAATGYHVFSVSGCSGTAYSNTTNAVSSYTYTTGAITGDCTVTATFAINTYAVAATAAANGTLDAATPSPIIVNYGDTPHFTFNAEPGYHVASISGCFGAAYNNTSNSVSSHNYTSGPVTADCTVTATFAINQYTVIGSVSGGHGSVVAPDSVTVNYGGTASFTFNADTGYHVASVSGCGGTAYSNTANSVSTYTYTTGAIAGDCTVTATFAINQYTVSASAGANGAIDAATPSPVTISHGSTASFTFNADTGYHVTSVSGCFGTAYNNASNAVNTYTYTTGPITADCTVTATFAINQYTVSASVGANGTLDAATPSPVTVLHGNTTSFTFNAATGYHITSISGCFGVEYNNTTNSVASHAYTCGPVTADCAVTATFAINQYTVSASAGANGALAAATPSPIIVNHGDTPAFTFNAAPGYHMASITGCFGTAYNNTANSVASHTYTSGPVTADCAITATFAINRYTVIATAEANGTLDAATPSPITVNYSDTPSFIFNANTGYHVTSASGCGGTTYSNTTNEVSTITYTTAPITADCAVTATFAINVYQVEFLHNANGHLSGNQSQTLNHGQNCTTVTALPDLGYRLQEWSGDYSGSENPLTVRNVIADMTINAVFHNDPPQVVITSPLDGSQAFGVLTVKANVTDDTRVAAVEFYIDGKLQERRTASQNDAQRTFQPSATKEIKEVSPDSALDIPDRSLQKGIWQFDLDDAQAMFLSAEGKARKVDSNGRISAVIHPDVDIAYLQLLPQINSLAVAFNEPQALENGKYYTIVLADFSRGELIGLEAAPALLASSFQTSPAFQTDGLNNLYYLMYNVDQALVMMTWNQARRSTTLFRSDHPILEWQVAQEGAILLKSAPVEGVVSGIRIWHPRLGWINENQSLLSGQTIQQWRRAAVSRGLAQSNKLETYFPQSTEIFHGHFENIQAVSLFDSLILIAGSQADLHRIELLDRDGNASVMVPANGLEVRKASWISSRQALLAGYDRASKKYVLAWLQRQPDEPPTVTYFCEVTAMPLQIQGAGFRENAGPHSGESDPGTGERKELKDASQDIAPRSSGTYTSSSSSQYTFIWDTMNFTVANHVLRVVAYDDAHASGADENTVAVAKVKLDLLAERRNVQSFSILRHYGQIQFLVEDFGIATAQYRILRRKGAGDFELLRTVTPAELQNHQFQMQDKYLEKSTPYTYRVEAYNAAEQLLGISLEKTI